MPELKLYTQVKDFLKVSGSFLEEDEMSNNLILGNCYNMLAENRSSDNCYFLNVFDNEDLDACSIKVSPKIILSSGSHESIEEIYRVYKDNNIQFKGVIGNKNAVEIFTQLHPAKAFQSRTTFIQSLSKVNELHLSKGKFEPSKLSNLPLLKKWMLLFFEEEHLRPAKSPEEVETFLKDLMKGGNLFSWTDDGKVLSVGAIIRKTKNTAVIGLVYTPEEFRGNGYAKSLVHQISEYILKSGLKQSGLLVYEENAVAKSIYEKIGYKTVSELLDVDFG